MSGPAVKRRIRMDGREMAYVEAGLGRPIVLLHGNPTSSFLWRRVMPALAGLGRCIAPDLIGMGDSDKLPGAGPYTYRFDTHARFLAGFMEAMGLDRDVILVLHDWGSALGFDWANSNRDAVAGVAYMEAIVQPFADWDAFSPQAAPLFQAFRSEAGEDLILARNLFIERVLTGSILRELSAAELAEYRRPYPTPESRWPMLTWPREIPVAGDPPDVAARVQAYADWMAQADFPKLFVNAEPGAILVGTVRAACRRWPNQQEATVRGSHFIQEDSGPEIGAAIAEWIRANWPGDEAAAQ